MQIVCSITHANLTIQWLEQIM